MDQVQGVLRALLSAAGGWAVGKGYIDGATAEQLGGALVVILTAVWSVVHKRQLAARAAG